MKHAPTNPTTLGDYLRLARIDRGLTQFELPRVRGVVNTTVEKREHNRLKMGPKSLRRVIAFVGAE